MKKLFAVLLVLFFASSASGAEVTNKSIGGILDLLGGATTKILVGGGTAPDAPVWTEATGTGAPVRAGSPTLTGTPNIAAPTLGGAMSCVDNIIQRAILKDYAETPHTEASSSGTLTLDLEDGNVFLVTLTENVTTFDISNWLASNAQSLTIVLTQDSSARTVDWTDESILWAGGTAPDITTVSTVHVITIMSPNGGTTRYGFHAGSEMATP